jgi:hypothetical protein
MKIRRIYLKSKTICSTNTSEISVKQRFGYIFEIAAFIVLAVYMWATHGKHKNAQLIKYMDIAGCVTSQ